MPWTKAPPELVELFYAALPEDPAVERRKMFGYPCAFVNGNMFTGVFAELIMVRLPDEQRAELLAIEGAAPFEPMAGRPMKEYVVLPESVLRNERALKGWIDKARLPAPAAALTMPERLRTPRPPAPPALPRSVGRRSGGRRAALPLRSSHRER